MSTTSAAFCPLCANLLLLEEKSTTSGLRFCCATCPYVYAITKGIKHKVPTQNKEVDDVLGGDEAWANVDSTEAKCPKCDHSRAFFMLVQTRSADEPMTTFFRCVKCKHPWKEG